MRPNKFAKGQRVGGISPQKSELEKNIGRPMYENPLNFPYSGREYSISGAMIPSIRSPILVSASETLLTSAKPECDEILLYTALLWSDI
jgi:hypothetical protein